MEESLTTPLKWAGSKRWAVPLLREIFAPHRQRRLVEPFAGSLAVALGLRPSLALLADTNPHLVNFYTRLRRSERPLALAMHYDKEQYYSARERFNALVVSPGGSESDEAAELFYYLNRTCFNGLCRFSRAGRFNVPFGKYKSIAYRTDFSVYTAVLRNWQIVCRDFTEIEVEPGDFVYLDPPYHGTFTDYSQGGFSTEEQVLLAERFAEHTGPVVASNAANDFTIDLYRRLGYEVAIVEAPRSIAASGSRAVAQEILAARNVEIADALQKSGCGTISVDKIMVGGVNVEPYISDASQARDENAVESEIEVESEIAVEIESEIAAESEVASGAAIPVVGTSASEDRAASEQGDCDMAYLPDSYAEEIAKAETYQRGERARDGEYVFLHLGIKYEKTRAGMALIVEQRVVESKKIVENVEPNAPGALVSYFLPDYGDAAVMLKPNLKNYLCGLIGRDPKTVDQKDEEFVKLVKAATGPQQIARGMYIRAVTFHTEKKDGEDFLGFNWMPCPGENHPAAPSVQARRRQLDEQDSKAASQPAQPQVPAQQPMMPQMGMQPQMPMMPQQMGMQSQMPMQQPMMPQMGMQPQMPMQQPAVPQMPMQQSLPQIPQIPTLPTQIKPWLSDGWQPYPNAPGFFFKGSEAKSEVDLTALYAGR